LLLTFPKPPLFPRLLPGTSVGNVKVTCSLTPSGYYDCLLTANALPVMIPPLIRESELLPILEQLDGVC